MNHVANHVASTRRPEARPLFRHSSRDALLPLVTVGQGVLLVALVRAPSPIALALLALHVWWTSNTIAHIHLHTPIFRSRALDRAFSLWLSLLTFIPQTIWKQRHLFHHAGEPAEFQKARLGMQGCLEIAVILAAVTALAAAAPQFLLLGCAPGIALGLLLCRLQGAMEHTRDGAPISHYGALYNFFWFNDGHHVEHHRRPTAHWTRLEQLTRGTPDEDATASALPPFARWAERVPVSAILLGLLERLNFGSTLLRSSILAVHRRALVRALEGATPERIAIVGGGLFPRTVLALQSILPEAKLTVIDVSAESIAIARAHLGVRAAEITFLESAWDERHDVYQLVIFPLAYVGDRRALYRGGRSMRLIHDWLWRGHGPIVSRLLLKRLNTVVPRIPSVP